MLYTEFVFEIVLIKILISSKFHFYFNFWPEPVDRKSSTSRPMSWQNARIRVHVCRSTDRLPGVDRSFDFTLCILPVDRGSRPGYVLSLSQGSVDCASRPIVHNGRIFELSVDRASRLIWPLNSNGQFFNCCLNLIFDFKNPFKGIFGTNYFLNFSNYFLTLNPSPLL